MPRLKSNLPYLCQSINAVMESIVCSCKKCGWTWGKLANLWIQVGKGYIGPPTYDEDASSLDIVPTGEVRLGEKHTLVDKCHLQDVACRKCQAVVGLKCVHTPINHVLHEKQLLLRLSSTVMTDSKTGHTIAPNVQRALKLRQASEQESVESNMDRRSDAGPSNSYTGKYSEEGGSTPLLDDDFYLDHLTTDLEAQRKEIQRINSAGHEAVYTLNDSINRIEAEVTGCKDTIFRLQQDLQSNNSRTGSLENEIASLKDEFKLFKQNSRDTARFDRLENAIGNTRQDVTSVREDLTNDVQRSKRAWKQERDTLKAELDITRNDMACLRRELDDAKKIARDSVSTMKTYAKDIASLRAEFGRLKQELSHNPPQKTSSSDGVLPSREIDILTSSITRISQRASQVETLQMEFELLKGRVQRIESRKETTRDDALTGQQQTVLAPPTEASKRKRASASIGQNIVGSEGSSNYSRAKGRAIVDWQSSPPSTGTQVANSGMPSTQRLTKSGAIDKRYLKRAKRRK